MMVQGQQYTAINDNQTNKIIWTVLQIGVTHHLHQSMLYVVPTVRL